MHKATMSSSAQCTFIALSASEEPLSMVGNIDFGSLSQQTLVELLIEKTVFAYQHDFHDADRLVKESCLCPGVRCTVEGEAHKIIWDRQFEGGFMDIQWIPSTVTDFFASYNNLHGTLHLTRLSNCLGKLVLKGNKFSGTIDLTRLPSSMKWLWVNENALRGTVDVGSLPQSLKILDLRSNYFVGKISLKNVSAVVFLENTSIEYE